MNASHWSYGQRCGLGSIETDLLVSLIRRRGSEADVFGAKITGRGCGGVVAVLLKSTDQALSAVEAAMAEYTLQTGHTPRLYRGSTPGALVAGAQRLWPTTCPPERSVFRCCLSCMICRIVLCNARIGRGSRSSSSRRGSPSIPANSLRHLLRVQSCARRCPSSFGTLQHLPTSCPLRSSDPFYAPSP